MNLGENIYRLRTEKNMSQGDFADALEVSRQSVSKWENNSAVPELDKLVKMAELFGITIDELVKGADTEQPTPPPQAAPAVSASTQQWHGRYSAGMLLIAFGVLFCILAIILELIFHSGIIWGCFAGAVMIACGVFCWTIEKHTALACGWVVYLAFNILLVVTTGGYAILAFTWAGALSLLLAVSGVALTIATLRKLWNGEITASKPVKIVLTVLMGILLLISIARVLPIKIEV